MYQLRKRLRTSESGACPRSTDATRSGERSDHLLLDELSVLLVGEEGIPEAYGGVVIPYGDIDSVQLLQIFRGEGEDANVLLRNDGREVSSSFSPARCKEKATNLDSSRVARLGDNSEIMPDSPRENDLRRGLAVFLSELLDDGVVDDSSLLGDLSGVGRVEVSCEDEGR